MIRTALAPIALAAATPALAQEEARAGPAGGLDVSGELGLLTDYRFRGLSRSDEDPALRAGVTLFHDSGLYAGARGTTLSGIEPLTGRDLGDAQVDLYAGWQTPLGGGFDVDAGVMYYVFAGADGATDYVEPYASLSYLIGPASFTAGAKYAPSQRAIGDEDMLYLFGQADVTVPFQPIAFSAQLGRQDSGALGSYWNWSVGMRHQLAVDGPVNAEIGLDYVDTDLPSRQGEDGGLVLSLNISF